MEHTIGLALGVLTGLGAAALLMALLLKKRIVDMTFDERQERARGVAFQYGFFTLVICVAVYGCLDVLVGRWCDTLTGCVLCICIAGAVFAVVCIWKDAYLSLRERPGAVMALLLGLAAFNLVCGLFIAAGGGLVENGILTYRASNLIAGGMIALILIAYAAKYHWDRKRGEA